MVTSLIYTLFVITSTLFPKLRGLSSPKPGKKCPLGADCNILWVRFPEQGAKPQKRTKPPLRFRTGEAVFSADSRIRQEGAKGGEDQKGPLSHQNLQGDGDGHDHHAQAGAGVQQQQRPAGLPRPVGADLPEPGDLPVLLLIPVGEADLLPGLGGQTASWVRASLRRYSFRSTTLPVWWIKLGVV